MKTNPLFLAVIGCFFFGLNACKETETTATENASSETQAEWTHTIGKTSAFYKGGPQQASPPDGELLKGTKVKVVQDSGSYSQVETENGQSGYVSTADILPIE